MIYVGIDPDVDKNGVAFWNSKTKELELSCESFFSLFDLLQSRQVDKVIIEAGWLNKSNFHLIPGMTKSSAAETGRRVGRNHEAGMKIVEMCEYLKLPNQIKKPEKSKVNHKKFVWMTKYTGGRTNQEKRDAAMLVYGL